MELVYIAISFALGGILKGATGAGAPIIAVPVLALLYDVPTAVVIFAVPNLVPNVWQFWKHRNDKLPAPLSWRFALAGGLGMVPGTLMLAYLPGQVLMLMVAFAVVVYIGFRLARPGWVLSKSVGNWLSIPAGFVGGVLQGSSGLSAPVSITFLNAMKPERTQFIATIALYFAALGLIQMPQLVFYGLMDWTRFFQSCLALIPLMAFMPVGAFIARHISKEIFDRIILMLLSLIAARLIFQAVTPWTSS